MREHFTLFIDESGEAGIGRVRSEASLGASPYMTLGASLIENQTRPRIEQVLVDLKNEIGKKSLHCKRLNHYQILHFIRKIAPIKMRHFGLISRKETLGKYKKQIEADSNKYYNKCVQYLLERVGWFMEVRGIPPDHLDVIFEKANFDYDKMHNFLSACQMNPKHQNTKRLSNISLGKISIKKKDEEPLLQLADLVAHALYKCADREPRHYGIPESRYLRELAPQFFGHPESHMVEGAGLYCVHSVRDLKLEMEVAELIESLQATPPS